MRKPITKRIRFDVFKRDRFTCTYCGGRSPSVVLHVDHIIPICGGGTNNFDNLTTSCEDCNVGKGRVDLSTGPITSLENTSHITAYRQQNGGMSLEEFGRLFSPPVNKSTVLRWERGFLTAQRAVEIERVVGIPRQKLMPEIFEGVSA